MHLLVLFNIRVLVLQAIVVLFIISKLSHLNQTLKTMSIYQMALMMHHSMNLKIILQLLTFNPLSQHARNWRALSRACNQLKGLKLLENCVASSISIEGFVFFTDN